MTPSPTCRYWGNAIDAPEEWYSLRTVCQEDSSVCCEPCIRRAADEYDPIDEPLLIDGTSS